MCQYVCGKGASPPRSRGFIRIKRSYRGAGNLFGGYQTGSNGRRHRPAGGLQRSSGTLLSQHCQNSRVCPRLPSFFCFFGPRLLPLPMALAFVDRFPCDRDAHDARLWAAQSPIRSSFTLQLSRYHTFTISCARTRTNTHTYPLALCTHTLTHWLSVDDTLTSQP